MTSFVVQLEVRETDSSSSIFLFQDCFGYSWSFVCVHTNCKIFCSNSVKNAISNLIEIALNLQVTLGSMAILAILILPVQEHGISFHFFVSSSISSVNVLQFSGDKFFTSLVRFIPKYFIFYLILKWSFLPFLYDYFVSIKKCS